MVVSMRTRPRRSVLAGLLAAVAGVSLCVGLLASIGSASDKQRVGPTVKLTDNSPYYSSYIHGFRVEGHTADYKDIFSHRLYRGQTFDFNGKMLIDFTLTEETDSRDLIRMWLVSFFGSAPHYDLTTSEILRESVPHGVRVRRRCWARDKGSYDC
jgi:hypothetical protein